MTQDDSSMVDRRAASRMSEEGDPPPGPSSGGASGSIDELRAELEAERERSDANLKQWQRAAADYQNLKRRAEQERQEATRFAQMALVINILPVFDDLDRALVTVDAHLAGLTWVQGVSAIHRKFAGALQAMDVREIDAEGTAFDPAQHEAVGQAPGPDGRVVHVLQKGYQLADRVIRPAMVIVGNGQSAAEPAPNAE